VAAARRSSQSVRVGVFEDTAPAVVWTDSRGHKYPVVATFTLDDEGLRCTTLVIGPTPGKGDGAPAIDKAALRELPLGDLTEQFTRRFARALKTTDEKVLHSLAEQVDALAPGPRAKSTDFYLEVAEVYLEARRQGRHPTKAVQDHFPGKVKRSTAATWIYRARKQWPERLGKTTQGRLPALTDTVRRGTR